MGEAADRRTSAVRAVLVAALLLVPLLATVQAARSGPRLHDVAVGLAGPPLLTQPVADAAAGSGELDVVLRPGQEDAAVVLADARSEVRAGSLDAAVVVDVRRSTDTLLMPATRSDAYVDAVKARIDAVSSGFGRDVRLARVAPSTGGDAPPWLPHVLVVLWVLLGLVAAGTLTAWRGPPVGSTGGLRRLPMLASAGIVGSALTAAVAVACSAPVVPLLLPAYATVVVAAWLTLAVEALCGGLGVAAATALLLGPVLPVLLGQDPDLLPSPWYDVRAFLPQDAALRLADGAVFGFGGGGEAAAALLVVWAAVATATAVLALHAAEVARSRSAPRGEGSSVGG